MNDLTRDCIEAIYEEIEQGYLTDVDSRLKYALVYLANDEDIDELYELIKTGKSPWRRQAIRDSINNIHPHYRGDLEEMQDE